MTVRWWLTAAFGPNEAAPQWLFLPILAPAVMALAYLRLRKAAV